jgi:outer membrane protein
MKRLILVLSALACGLAMTAVAQTAPAAAPAPGAPPTAKVAVISFQAAVGQTNEFQRNFADMQKKYDPRRAQLKAMGDEVDALEKQLQATGDKLSDSERAAKEKSLEDKKRDAQRFADDAKNDLGQEMNDLFNTVAVKVLEVMNTYAQQHGYTLVVDGSSSQEQTPVVLYAAENTDITKAVIDAYNVKSGVPPPQSSAIPSAPKPAAH